MTKTIFKISLFILLGVFLGIGSVSAQFGISSVYAQCALCPDGSPSSDCSGSPASCPAPANYCPPNEICPPTSSRTFEELLVRVTFYLLILSIPIVSIMILWGAFLMLTSAGDPGKIQKGKDTIKWAVVGFIAVILAGGVASIIKELIGVSAS